MISASRVPTYLACQAAAVLPQSDYRTVYADQGQDFHGDMEAAADIGDGLPAKVAALTAGASLTSECAFAYDVASDTARELGHVQRKYAGLTPYEIPGTLDLLARGDRMLVVDYKGHEKVDDAATNTQLATYALMVARTYGVFEVDVAIYYRSTGWLDTATLGPLELDAHAARLRQLQIDVARAAADPKPVIGRQCRYCNAFNACPAQADLRVDVDRSLPMRVEASLPYHDDGTAADAFDLLSRVELLAKRMRAALYARAAEKPIPLNDGRVLGPVEKMSATEIDVQRGYQVLLDKYGPQIASECLTQKLTQAGIDRALKKHGHDKRAAMKALADAGAAKRETRTTIEPHEPQTGAGQ
jgi:hypothetical protein